MSAPDPLTLASIQRQQVKRTWDGESGQRVERVCGCTHVPGGLREWYLCQWHIGFDEGVDAMRGAHRTSGGTPGR